MPEKVKVKIRGKQYVMPRPEDMKRGQAKKLKTIMQTLSGDGSDVAVLDAPWDILEVLIPSLPADVLDDLTMEECQNLIVDAGFIDSFGGEESVSLGESSASSNS